MRYLDGTSGDEECGTTDDAEKVSFFQIVPAQARTLQPPRVMSRGERSGEIKDQCIITVVLPINQKIDRSFDAIDPNGIAPFLDL